MSFNLQIPNYSNSRNISILPIYRNHIFTSKPNCKEYLSLLKWIKLTLKLFIGSMVQVRQIDLIYLARKVSVCNDTVKMHHDNKFVSFSNCIAITHFNNLKIKSMTCFFTCIAGIPRTSCYQNFSIFMFQIRLF